MLREVARHADHLPGQRQHAAKMRVGDVHAGFGDVALADLLAEPAPHRLGERGGHVLGQPHRLADLADRHARAVVDHRGGQPGAVAAILAVEMLDHLLAPLVLEIDVDIGRLAAFFGDEPVEQ